MHIWRAVRGEGSELGILARTQSTPPQVRTGIVVGAGGGEGLAEGCWKTANEQR